MNYTEKYHLPQWAESDRILMTDFNQMCADIEAGITAAKAAADSAGTTASQAKATGDDLAPRVTAVENAVKFVKLGDLQAGANSSVTFDLSGLAMAQFSNLIVDCVFTGYSGATMYLNGDTGAKYTDEYTSNGTQGISLTSEGGGPGHTMAVLHPHGAQISCVRQMEASVSYGAAYSAAATCYTGCSWASLRSLVLKTASGGQTVFHLYGVKI